VNSKNKKRLGFLGFVFVVFHSTFLIIFAAPSNLMPKAAQEFVTPYVSPVFDQKWAMFAPCPLIESSMKMKIYYEDDSLDWFYPAKDAFKWHSYFRVTHHGELVLTESNMLHWVYADAVDFELKYGEPFPNELRESFFKGYSYNIVKRYVRGLSLKIKGEIPTSAEVICEFYNVKEETGGDIYLPEFKFGNK
jgi:hypothetical protein